MVVLKMVRKEQLSDPKEEPSRADWQARDLTVSMDRLEDLGLTKVHLLPLVVGQKLLDLCCEVTAPVEVVIVAAHVLVADQRAHCLAVILDQDVVAAMGDVMLAQTPDQNPCRSAHLVAWVMEIFVSNHSPPWDPFCRLVLGVSGAHTLRGTTSAPYQAIDVAGD